MTVVVGIRGRNGAVIAADKVATSGRGDQRSLRWPKVASLTPVVAVGVAGSPRVSQVLRYHAQLPPLPLGADELDWAVRGFVPALRKALKEHGAMYVDGCVENVDGHSCLVLAVRSRVFSVYSDLQVDEDEVPFATIGSGGDYAAGVLADAISEDEDAVADARLEKLAARAVVAAAEMNSTVGGGVSSVRTAAYSEEEKQIARAVLGGRR